MLPEQKMPPGEWEHYGRVEEARQLQAKLRDEFGKKWGGRADRTGRQEEVIRAGAVFTPHVELIPSRQPEHVIREEWVEQISAIYQRLLLQEAGKAVNVIDAITRITGITFHLGYSRERGELYAVWSNFSTNEELARVTFKWLR